MYGLDASEDEDVGVQKETTLSGRTGQIVTNALWSGKMKNW
jgi:hypothetical protein